MKKLLFILFLGSSASFGQTNFKAPVLFPPSPDVANMEKYGTYQVSYATGLPEISIPLYTIKQNSLEVPITLSYHASGIKVADDAGWIGLGWSLSAGGQISRQVKGNQPDENVSNGYLFRGTPTAAQIDYTTQAGLDYLDQQYKGNIDSEPDIFSYSFPGKSGKFFFDKNDSFKPKVIPFDPLQVNYQSGYFKILDERGLSYDFQTIEQTQNNSSPTVTSAWMLNKITSANKKDEVEFLYTTRYGLTYSDPTQFIVVSDIIEGEGGTFGIQPAVNSVSQIRSLEQKLDIIKFKDGRVKFQLADREDGFTTPTPQKRLTTITIESFNSHTNQYTVVKTILFVQTYFVNGPTKRLRLDEVRITDGSNPIQVYRFQYNELYMLPATTSFARDHWGYYNGESSNTDLIPKTQISFQASNTATAITLTVGNAIREPNPNYSQANMLRRIIFPTGGYTDFYFEPNRYIEGSNVKIGGGVRIKRIESYDGTKPTPFTRTYKYGDNEVGYGQKNFFLSNYNYSTSVTEQIVGHVQFSNCEIQKVGSRRVRTFISFPSIDIVPYDGCTVFYPTVTEYEGHSALNEGKTIYRFTNETDNLQSDCAAGGQCAIFSQHFKRGLLIDKEVFKRQSGAYKRVLRTVNTYQAFPNANYSGIGYRVKKNRVTINRDNGEELKLDPIGVNLCGLHDSDNFVWLGGYYAILSGDQKLASTTEYVYDTSDDTKFTVATTNYEYSSLSHLQITRSTTTQSDGKVKSVVNRYPVDFSTQAPYTSMLASSSNMIALPVEREQQINSTKLSLEKTQWKDYGNNIIQPEKVFTQTQTNPLEQEIVYDYDDQGRIKEFTTRDGLTTSIVWGFSQSIPIAQVINARSTQVAFTSFEDTGKGNWTYTGSPVASATAKTGGYVFNGGLSKSGLDSGTPSLLQLWIQGSNTLTVTTPAGTITGQLLETRSGWSLYSYNLGAVASVTIGNPGISIDDVRLYPQAAQVKSYNTKNLVGIDAVSDINNQYSKFEYDLFGRLKAIKDNNNNIVKSAAYGYKSTTDYLAPFVYEYYNNAVTYTFQKQCPAGYRGSLVGYSIPAAKYSSELGLVTANDMAYNEAQTYGPAKAEADGVCTQIIYATIIATNARGDAGYKIRFEPLSGQPSLPLFNLASGIGVETTIVVEAGTYKISIFRDTAPFPNRNFSIFGTDYAGVISATKDNVAVSPTSNNKIRLWSSP